MQKSGVSVKFSITGAYIREALRPFLKKLPLTFLVKFPHFSNFNSFTNVYVLNIRVNNKILINASVLCHSNSVWFVQSVVKYYMQSTGILKYIKNPEGVILMDIEVTRIQ